MDIKLVFNEKKVVANMCAYLGKSGDTCSNAMKQALKLSIENKCSNYEQMKTIVCAYSSNRECSVQEAVYQCLPELWLRKIFPGVKYANTNIPQKRFKLLRSQNETGDLPDDSNDIFKRICLRCLQPTELKDELPEVNSPAAGCPIKTSLMSSKEKIVFVL